MERLECLALSGLDLVDKSIKGRAGSMRFVPPTNEAKTLKGIACR